MNLLMTNLAFLIDGIGAGAGIAFFVALAALAAVAFFVIKRTVKMAIRMLVVAAILLIALVGGISFWMFTSSTEKPATRPTNTRNR